MMEANWVFRRGDIYCADLEPVVGSEQGGVRPVVVIQNDVGNKFSPTLIVAAITSQIESKAKLPTHYLFEGNPAFREPSMALLEQIRTLDKRRVDTFLGKATTKEMRGIDKALSVSLAMGHITGHGMKKVKEGVNV